MGAASSIHPEVIKSIEVSFVDKKTMRLLSEQEIIEISYEACKEFDYKPSFYDAYKVGKDGKNPYEEYSRKLRAGAIR
jgi:hypothetical protein